MEPLFIGYGIEQKGVDGVIDITNSPKRPQLTQLLENYFEGFPGLQEVETRHSMRPSLMLMAFFDPEESKATFDYTMTNINGQPYFTGTEKRGGLDRQKGVPIEIVFDTEQFSAHHEQYLDTKQQTELLS